MKERTTASGQKMTEQEYKEYMIGLYWYECSNFKERPNFTDEEEGFRRGFVHGFVAKMMNPDLPLTDVTDWRYGNSLTAPPGTGCAGQEMPGLTKDDKQTKNGC